MCSMKPGVRTSQALGRTPKQLFGEDSAPYPEDAGPTEPRAALGWETQGLHASSGLAHTSVTPQRLAPRLGLSRLVLGCLRECPREL